jgi:hypothetical protein
MNALGPVDIVHVGLSLAPTMASLARLPLAASPSLRSVNRGGPIEQRQLRPVDFQQAAASDLGLGNRLRRFRTITATISATSAG